MRSLKLFSASTLVFALLVSMLTIQSAKADDVTYYGAANSQIYLNSDGQLILKWWNDIRDPAVSVAGSNLPLVFDISYTGATMLGESIIQTFGQVTAKWGDYDLPPQTDENGIYREYMIPLPAIVGETYTATIVTWFDARNIAGSSATSAEVSFTVTEAPTTREDPGPGDDEQLPLESCNSTPNDPRKVLMLSITYSEVLDGHSGYRTDVEESDSRLHNYLCTIGARVDIFNGSAEGWAELEYYTDLIIPASIGYETSILADSRIMTAEILAEIKTWVRNGGNIQILGTYAQRELISELTDTDISGNFSLPYLDSDHTAVIKDFTYDAAGDPQHIPNFPDSLEINTQTPQLEVDALSVLYKDSIFKKKSILLDEAGYYLSARNYLIAGIHPEGFGQIGIFSAALFDEVDNPNEFSAAALSDWLVVIGASLSGHLSSNIALEPDDAAGFEFESIGTSVVGGDPGGDLIEMGNGAFDNGLVVRLGNNQNPITIPCANTSKNPSILRKSAIGTSLICGKVHLDDGRSEAGVDAQLIRWFSTDKSWIRTSVKFSSKIYYQGFVGLFSDLGSDEQTVIHQTNVYPFGVDDLSSVENDLTWFTSGVDQNAESYAGESSPVVISMLNSLGPDSRGGQGAEYPEELYRPGGAGYLVNRSQTLTYENFDVGGPGNAFDISFSWFTGLVNYEPGCDREAANLAVDAANEFMAENVTAITEEGEVVDYDFTYINDETASIFALEDEIYSGDLKLPSLENDCEPYQVLPVLSEQNVAIDSATIQVAETFQVDENEADFGTTEYEMQLKLDSDVDWEQLTNAVWQDGHWGVTVTGLSYSTLYSARSRAWDGDRHGPWSEEIFFRTLAEVSESPSPAPSSESTVSPPLPNQTPSSYSGVVINAQPSVQTAPATPTQIKPGKKLIFGVTWGNLPLKVTSLGACKTTQTSKFVRVQVGKRKRFIKIQTGWKVTMSRKNGTCTVIFVNTGDSDTEALTQTATIQVKK
jgi:hypothetical protein